MNEQNKKVPTVRFKGFTNDWEQRKLGELMTIKSGLSTNTQSKHSQYKITRIETISNGSINMDRTGSVSNKPGDEYLMHTGDILFSNINSLDHIGKVAIFDGKSVLYHGMNLLRIVAKPQVYSFFIYYELTTSNHRNWAKAHANPAVSQASINQRSLSSEPVHVTNLIEQHQISKLINKIDALITLQQRKLALLKQLKKGMLQKMFAEKNSKQPILRFKGFHDDWEQRKLSTLVTLHARIGWQNLRTSEFLDAGNYMLITGTDFNNGKIDYSKVHYVEKNRYDQDPKLQLHNGNILITKDGTIGKVAYVDSLKMPATLNAGVFNVTVKNKGETNNKYLFNYLNAPFLMKYATAESTGGTIKHLNQKVLVNFPVPISSIKEQNKISNLLENINKSLSLQQQKLAKYQSIKKSLLQQMFI